MSCLSSLLLQFSLMHFNSHSVSCSKRKKIAHKFTPVAKTSQPPPSYETCWSILTSFESVLFPLSLSIQPWPEPFHLHLPSVWSAEHGLLRAAGACQQIPCQLQGIFGRPSPLPFLANSLVHIDDPATLGMSSLCIDALGQP